MSHQFFEPEMGLSTLPAHFQQKKAKKAKNNFQRAGGKICFLSRDRKYSCPGTGNGFFLPLSDFFFIFLPSIWKLCFGLFVFFGLFDLFLAFLAFDDLFKIVKHSLDVGITSKMEESHILHGKNVPPWIFFSPQTEVYPRAGFTPLGSQLQPSLRSCVKTTLGG